MGAPDFEEIVDAYYAQLYRFALSLAHGEAAAADLTQQTFYLWASKGHQLRDVSKVKSWLFTTLYREFLGMHRRESRFPQANLEEEADDLPAVTESISNSIDGAAAVEALQQIDPVFRAPLALFYLDELSYREIAEVLGVPAGTVMSRLSRGKKMLRKILLHQEMDASAKIIPMELPPKSGASSVGKGGSR